MSLAISFCTSHGIVMGADRCITTTLADGKSFCGTTQERKLFLSPTGYGFSYTGASTYRGLPASYWMERLIERFSTPDRDVPGLVMKLCAAFYSLDPQQNTIMIGAGYQDGKPQVYSCASGKRSLTDHLQGKLDCIAYSGETDLARKVIDAVPVDRSSYTIPDAIDFTKHVITTVSNIQRFAPTPVTVSPDCDILVITARGARWVEPPLFLI